MELSFDDIRFDAAARLMHRGASQVHLTPKAFDLLHLLLERRPAAVSKREIHQRLWPDAFVSDTNLRALIAEIRDAIGDDARQPRFIRTVHGFGYAFTCAINPGSGRRPSDQAGRALWRLRGEAETIPLVTGEHVLGRGGDGVTVEDLGSKNGTYVHDEPVTSPRPLKQGDSLRLGSALFTLEQAANTAEATQTSTASPRRP